MEMQTGAAESAQRASQRYLKCPWAT